MASKQSQPDNRTLPSKEAALFRQLAKQYEVGSSLESEMPACRSARAFLRCRSLLRVMDIRIAHCKSRDANAAGLAVAAAAAGEPPLVYLSSAVPTRAVL